MHSNFLDCFKCVYRKPTVTQKYQSILCLFILWDNFLTVLSTFPAPSLVGQNLMLAHLLPLTLLTRWHLIEKSRMRFCVILSGTKSHCIRSGTRFRCKLERDIVSFYPEQDFDLSSWRSLVSFWSNDTLPGGSFDQHGLSIAGKLRALGQEGVLDISHFHNILF